MKARIKHRSLTVIDWYSVVDGVSNDTEALEAHRNGDSEPQDYEIGDSHEWLKPEVVDFYEEEGEEPMMALREPVCPNCLCATQFGEIDTVLAYVNAIAANRYIEWTGDTDLDTQRAADNPPLFECTRCGGKFPLAALVTATFRTRKKGDDYAEVDVD
jgi:hypothetical protein